MGKKRFYAIALCMTLAICGCGSSGQEQKNAESGTAETTSAILSAESSASEETVSTEAETTAETVEKQETITDSEEISEEDIYWKSVIEQDFANSEYDLSAALLGPALKDLCSDYFTLGVGINGSTLENQTLNSPEYMTVCKKHFNSCTITNLMKSCYILNQEGSKESLESGDGSPVLSFESIDPTLQWCMENGMKMRGHTLVWHTQAPEWFFREGYSEDGDYVDKDTMLFRMESYIAQLMTHVQEEYPDVIYCWDVVNEAVDPDKGNPDSAFLCRMEVDGRVNPWYATIGEDYVEMAFTYARKYAAEGVSLFYNDFNTFQPNKRDAIYNLCESLKEKGLIDGIGMQGYYSVGYPDMTTIETAIRKFAALELELQLTELSISVDEETEEQFTKQANKYGSLLITLHNLDTQGGGPANITNVTFFGLIDHYREGDTTNTRLFDSEYQPKPAFDKVKAIFEMSYQK